MLQSDRQFFPLPANLSLCTSVSLTRRDPAKKKKKNNCPTCVPCSPRDPCGCLAGQRRRSGRHECGLRGADWRRSEWGDNGEGGTRMTSKHMRERLADTHTSAFCCRSEKSFTPLLYAGANWVNGYQTPVVWFMLFLITRPFSFCHVGLCLRIKSTLLSVVESTLLPQLHFGWPLTSLFANIITYCEFLSECKINFTEWCESCYLYSSITGGVYQSVSLNNLTFSYFFKRVWRYISLISSDM